MALGGALNWLVGKLAIGLNMVGFVVGAVGRYISNHMYLIFAALCPGLFWGMQLIRWAMGLVTGYINNMAVEALAVTTSMGSPLAGVSVFVMLQNINYIFPLSETLLMLMLFFSLKLLLLLYRFIKSWIPTVS